MSLTPHSSHFITPKTWLYVKILCFSLMSTTYYAINHDMNLIRFFSLEPRAIKVFSFGRDVDSYSEDLLQNRRVIEHGKHYVKMVDRAIDLLGPDIELLTEILLELGKQHERLGVEASYYPPMQEALLQTLSELLGDRFSEAVRAAWVKVYKELADDMIRAIANEK